MRQHGKPGTYTSGCRCDACREAWRVYRRSNRGDRTQEAWRLRNLAAGLTRDGYPRKSKPYTERDLRMLQEAGLEPDPRWMP